jgi:hypothetical protein
VFFYFTIFNKHNNILSSNFDKFSLLILKACVNV